MERSVAIKKEKPFHTLIIALTTIQFNSSGYSRKGNKKKTSIPNSSSEKRRKIFF
jgi:hypothetical protein